MSHFEKLIKFIFQVYNFNKIFPLLSCLLWYQIQDQYDVNYKSLLIKIHEQINTSQILVQV